MQRSTHHATRVEIKVVPAEHMPDGHILIPLQHTAGITLTIKEGEMTTELAAAINRILPHLTGDGILTELPPRAS